MLVTGLHISSLKDHIKASRVLEHYLRLRLQTVEIARHRNANHVDVSQRDQVATPLFRVQPTADVRCCQENVERRGSDMFRRGVG